MKKIIFAILIATTCYSQNENIYGLWYNSDKEYVEILNDNSFIRYGKNQYGGRKNLAIGYIEFYDEDQFTMHVRRTDTILNYDLGYFIGNETMVIEKPNTPNAWLWQKISDY